MKDGFAWPIIAHTVVMGRPYSVSQTEPALCRRLCQERRPSRESSPAASATAISIGGKLARSGRVQVRVDSYLRTIRQSEDDFINVCINDTETLYSGGGRLFCFHREFSYSMRLLR